MSAARARTRAPAAQGDPRRRAELAKIHLACKALGLDDDTYRDLLARVTGQRSAGALNQRQRSAVLDALAEAGFRPTPPARAGTRRPLAREPQAMKARALWIGLWNLGVVASAEEAALAGFCKRQTGQAALQWCGPEELNKVIEGLRAMAARHGWRPGRDPIAARQALLATQVARLRALGETPLPPLPMTDAAELDRAAAVLGERLRAAGRMPAGGDNG